MPKRAALSRAASLIQEQDQEFQEDDQPRNNRNVTLVLLLKPLGATRRGRAAAAQRVQVLSLLQGVHALPEALVAPGAARQSVGPLEAWDVGLEAGAKVPEIAIDPAALTMSSIPRPPFLWKAM